MLKILRKYLITETAYAIITVLLILLIILSSNTMMRLIEEAAEGNFPTYLLFPTILIKIAQYLIYLIPISLFLALFYLLEGYTIRMKWLLYPQPVFHQKILPNF